MSKLIEGIYQYTVDLKEDCEDCVMEVIICQRDVVKGKSRAVGLQIDKEQLDKWFDEREGEEKDIYEQ